jgi:hypothetical protein
MHLVQRLVDRQVSLGRGFQVVQELRQRRHRAFVQLFLRRAVREHLGRFLDDLIESGAAAASGVDQLVLGTRALRVRQADEEIEAVLRLAAGAGQALRQRLEEDVPVAGPPGGATQAAQHLPRTALQAVGKQIAEQPQRRCGAACADAQLMDLLDVGAELRRQRQALPHRLETQTQDASRRCRHRCVAVQVRDPLGVSHRLPSHTACARNRGGSPRSGARRRAAVRAPAPR